MYRSSKKLLGVLFAALSLASCGYSGPYVGTMRAEESKSSSPTPEAITQLNRAINSRATKNASSASSDYHLGPEDLLEITLFNVPPDEVGVTPRVSTTRVNPEGNINLPLLGDIHVANLTADEVRDLLGKRYDKYLYDTQLGIRILEHHNMQVSVLGAVAGPGMFELTSPKTVMDMIAMAKGLRRDASSKVYLHRRGKNGKRTTYIIDLRVLTTHPGAIDKPVYAGDVLYVPKADMFYVDGAVRKAGSYPLVRDYTLTQALASAGGVRRDLADTTEVSIMRIAPNGETHSLSYDLDDILAGKVKDPSLHAEDVVFVPIHGGKYFISRFVGGISMGRFVPAPPAF